jgi:hypothetical protein
MSLQSIALFSLLSFANACLFGTYPNLKQKALRGDTDAQIRIGFNYMNQTPADWAESKFWFLMASDRNQPTPCFLLGHIFQHGLGTPINLAKSIYFYEKGASLKSTDCSKALALLYNKQMKFIDANAWKIIHLDSTKDLSDESILTTIASLDTFEKEEAKLLATEIRSSWLIQNESTILDPTTKAPKFRSITLSNGNDYKGYIFKGIPNGYGMVKSNSGGTYFGYFKNGRMHGPGQQFSSDGKIIFKGHWSNGIPVTW